MNTSSKKKTRTAKKAATNGMTVSATFAIVGGVLLAYHLFVAPTNIAQASNSGAANSIMVVDSKAVLQAFMDKKVEEVSAGGDFTESEVRLSGAEFAAEYMRAIKKYRDRGYLVIDKQYALGVPVASEITEEIGDALNLSVKAGADPFSAPELE